MILTNVIKWIRYSDTIINLNRVNAVKQSPSGKIIRFFFKDGSSLDVENTTIDELWDIIDNDYTKKDNNL